MKNTLFIFIVWNLLISISLVYGFVLPNNDDIIPIKYYIDCELDIPVDALGIRLLRIYPEHSSSHYRGYYHSGPHIIDLFGCNQSIFNHELAHHIQDQNGYADFILPHDDFFYQVYYLLEQNTKRGGT